MALQLPTNSLVSPLLTDLYQVSMAYAYWLNGRAEDYAVFDLFFRKNPFQGEFCIFAGLSEVIKFVSTYKFTASDMDYLRDLLPHCQPAFFVWLESMDCSQVKLYSIDEGSVVFPRLPLIRVEGPMAIVQLLETTLLNLVNFPSLIATNAARMRLVVGNGPNMLEFGLRRAQGPDGALTASKYSYIGGFNGSSNVLAGKLFGINVKGTMAHSYIMCYTGLQELKSNLLTPKVASKGGDATATIAGSGTIAVEPVDFLGLVLEKRKILGFEEANEGELASFISYSQAFPHNFLALLDTYDTLQSGVQNFLSVGWALYELGFQPVGIRLDSGDLAYLSKKVREAFVKADKTIGIDIFAKCAIVVSNDINEDVLLSLIRDGHSIDTFAVGTNLVTCQKQPALGCVFKLVEINGKPRIKLSQDMEKLAIPGKKSVFRLYGVDGNPLVDVMQTEDEAPPLPGVRMLVRHAFSENKRAHVTPSAVKPMLKLVFDGTLTKNPTNNNGGGGGGEDDGCAPPHTGIIYKERSLDEIRQHCLSEISRMRHDHCRPLNPTPYKVSVSQHLYEFMHTLWMAEAPIADLC